jgi:hypothetical protein
MFFPKKHLNNNVNLMNKAGMSPSETNIRLFKEQTLPLVKVPRLSFHPNPVFVNDESQSK